MRDRYGVVAGADKCLVHGNATGAVYNGAPGLCPAPVPLRADREIQQAGRVSYPDCTQYRDECDLLIQLSVHDVLLGCRCGA